MKTRSKKRRRGSFLERFKLDEAYLVRPDRKLGRPGILIGTDVEENRVLVKVWPKTPGAPDDDLREIWHHELRQLHRLGGYPGAAETVASLSQAETDESGFYLVLNLGQRRPLAALLKAGPNGKSLANPRLASTRARLWQNLARIASGLETLHAQGLLHRNLDAWSILTTGGDEPDFQLTGFEWSIRLMGAAVEKNLSRASERSPGEPASFLQDWRALGKLAAELLGVNAKRLEDSEIPASSVSDYLTIDEVRLLRQLILAERLDRLDGEVVDQRIKDVLRSLQADIAGREAKFNLVLTLGQGSKLSQQIREASGNLLEIGAIEDQLAFVKADLSASPLLIAVKTLGNDFRLILQGIKLVYTLEAYVPPKLAAPPTWEMASCDRCERANPAAVNIVGSLPLPPKSLELMSFREATVRFSRLRGKLSSWESLRSELEQRSPEPDKLQRLHQAIALTQFIEALYAAADTFPVDIVGVGKDTEGDLARLNVTLREDAERDALSLALGIKPPARRFEDALKDDRRGDEWVLTESRHVGQREVTDTSWRFVSVQPRKRSSPAFIFSGNNPPPNLRNPVFIPGDFVGRDAQLRRRLKALRALADHSELLRMLVDPRLRILESHETVKSDAIFAALDESKQAAMRAIVSTLPLFLVQGPPGVGKTRLVRDLVTEIFTDDATGRVLLTAQSNAAVNHLMNELQDVLSAGSERALIVRCQPRESKDDAGPYEISHKSQTLLEKLAKSRLVTEGPPHLQSAMRELVAPSSDGERPTSGKTKPTYGRQAFEGLIVRAANVVFATTNAFELERLIDERGQFDWSIVEEAGKATGGELLAPLLLSYRRLMIGDHKQLSPFGSERAIRLLEDPEATKQALKVGSEFISRTLRDPSTDEVLDEIDEEAGDFPALCSLAIGCIVLFEKLIEAEFEVHKRNSNARRLAHRLNQQHRMHPAIARLVSHCFYDDDLKSHKDTIQRFEREQCPIASTDAKRLPNAPIVIVDMPYVQTTIGKKDGERHPRWHNPDEVEAVLGVLTLLKADVGAETPPSLAILSPYREQVQRLKAQVDENLTAFPNLGAFRRAVTPTTYCGTVDSFQGNEADVVIISLVRNNHHSSVRSALGFLSDFRRMNVLLSRAKSRMIVVGSMAFLDEVLNSARSTDAAADIQFLDRFRSALEKERSSGNVVIIPPTRLLRERSK